MQQKLDVNYINLGEIPNKKKELLERVEKEFRGKYIDLTENYGRCELTLGNTLNPIKLNADEVYKLWNFMLEFDDILKFETLAKKLFPPVEEVTEEGKEGN